VASDGTAMSTITTATSKQRAMSELSDNIRWLMLNP
jgi:hypothetical protein